MSPPLLHARDLSKHFESTTGLLGWKRTHLVKAVDSITFSLGQNEVLGMVGESGCGKSTSGNLLLRIHEPTGGEILFRGNPISGMTDADLREYRRQVQMVFQDPFASLDPMMTLSDIVGEPFVIFGMHTKTERAEIAEELLRRVGLEGAYGGRYPHELSGGQRQRVAIARALALNPSVIIADEPTSALDVSVKAQIINLLEDLGRQEGLSILFISHDLSMVSHISDRVVVMYLGKIVESGPTGDLFEKPLHPYSRLLIDAIPIPDPKIKRRRTLIRGEISDTETVTQGCVFYPRCNRHQNRCLEKHPPLEAAGGDRSVACYFPER